jgi:hypothetical protein
MDASRQCCILNADPAGWVFDDLARSLSEALWVDVSTTARDYSYVLSLEVGQDDIPGRSFIPLTSVHIASDKRTQAKAFLDGGVPIPTTHLVDSRDDANAIIASNPNSTWCLKWPIGCGAAGHRILTADVKIPDIWPRPYVVQEFIRLERPEVYRTYGIGGELYGWVVRKYPDGVEPSPWVAHARGARYADIGIPPPEAAARAVAALTATGLLSSFGCVDLLHSPDDGWLVLEVGTDGVYNHVDRDLELPHVENEILRRIAEAFWANYEEKPWGTERWRPQSRRI